MGLLCQQTISAHAEGWQHGRFGLSMISFLAKRDLLGVPFQLHFYYLTFKCICLEFPWQYSSCTDVELALSLWLGLVIQNMSNFEEIMRAFPPG